MSNASVSKGDRVRWTGDFSNDPKSGEVVEIADGFMFIRWDGETVAKPSPLALMRTPRWSKLAK